MGAIKQFTVAELREKQRIRQSLWRKQNPQKVKDQAERRFPKIVDEFKFDDSFVALDEDQLFYLLNHRAEKRTKLAKKLGVMKFQVTQMLYKLLIQEMEEAQC